MGCHQNSGLFPGLEGECEIVEIGCVPLTSGTPTFTPEIDQLPLAYDPETGSLYLWQCDEGPWVEIKHETLCDLNPVDINAVTDICTNLNIPVTFSDQGECQEGTTTLNDLAAKIKECLDLRTICELDFLSDQDVDAANSVQIAGCVDGQSVLMNPISLCRLQVLTPQEVDAATNVRMAACVDGQEVLIDPYSYNICELQSLTQEEVNNAQSVQIAGCVDGQEVLMDPFSLCSLSNIVIPGAPDINDVCSDLNIPVAYNDAGNNCVQGLITAQQLTNAVEQCIDFPPEFSICGLDIIGAIPGPPQLFDVCNQIYVPISYTRSDTNECVEGNIRIFQLANELISQCMIQPTPFSICNLQDVTPNDVINAADVEVGICIDGVDRKVDLPVIYEPVTIKGLGGRVGGCYVIDNVNNPSAKLFDSRFGVYEGFAGLPVEWSFTNTTSEPGIVKIHGSFWITRYETNVGNYARTPANLMFMLGLKSSTDTYVFDEAAVFPAAVHPRSDNDVSYDARLLPTEPYYKFFGNWFSGVAPSADLSMEASADLDHEYVIQPGQTLTFAAVTAVGYQNAINTAGGDIERSWLGFNIHYTFEGHNRVL